MSELGTLSKREACFIVEAFVKNAGIAKDNVILTKELKEVNYYLQILENYSQKIDAELCQTLSSLKSSVNTNYAGNPILSDEAVDLISGWYDFFLTKIHGYITKMPASEQQEYSGILKAIDEQTVNMNSGFSSLSSLITEKFGTLEKVLNLNSTQKQTLKKMNIEKIKDEKVNLDLVKSAGIPFILDETKEYTFKEFVETVYFNGGKDKDNLVAGCYEPLVNARIGILYKKLKII